VRLKDIALYGSDADNHGEFIAKGFLDKITRRDIGVRLRERIIGVDNNI
jgi:hypothetical protein